LSELEEKKGTHKRIWLRRQEEEYPEEGGIAERPSSLGAFSCGRGGEGDYPENSPRSGERRSIIISGGLKNGTELQGNTLRGFRRGLTPEKN